VQKAIGYSLSASTAEQCMFILHGAGANGKSTFLETIKVVMGDYAMSALASAVMEKQNGNIPNDIARLRGSRFVNVTETDENKKMSESIIKTITGGDKIVARFLNKEFFEFDATFKLFLATNHIPKITGTDNGIWRRIKYIPFKRTFEPHERDRKIMQKLWDEREGILTWAIEGHRLWTAEGLGSCDEVDEAVRAYREDSDILAEFISDKCVYGSDEMVQASVLYKAMYEWYRNQGLYKPSRNKLMEYLKSKKCTNSMATNGVLMGMKIWEGIGLKMTDVFDPGIGF
jgi:putative DNA primase/helicase